MYMYQFEIEVSFQNNYFSLNLCTDNVTHIIESTTESLMTMGLLLFQIKFLLIYLN